MFTHGTWKRGGPVGALGISETRKLSIFMYTTFIKSSIHKSICSNALLKTQYTMIIKYNINKIINL